MKEGLAASAKAEILEKEFKSECCERAFLSAVIHTAGSLLIGGGGKLSVLIRSSNIALKERLDILLSALYGITCVAEGGEILIKETGSNKEIVLSILCDCGIFQKGESLEIVAGICPRVVANDCCKSSYVGGAFVGCGSLSATKTGYHLEFKFEGREMSDDFSMLLKDYGINAKYIERKSKHIIYLKDNELIGDCLALCGTGSTTLSISGMYVDRWQRREINRQMNCDLANMERTINAGLRQADLFFGILDKLTDERLRKTAQARIANPEATYDELAIMLGVSKSGMKHRLKKLEEIALKRDF